MTIIVHDNWVIQFDLIWYNFKKQYLLYSKISENYKNIMSGKY
jgi:hypothetical protein